MNVSARTADSFPSHLLNRDLALIFASNFFGSFGDGLYSYLLPVYMTRTLGTSSTEIGILYAIVNLFGASTLLLGGILADRYDPKKVMAVGWALWVPAPILFALARTWPEMILGMVFWGFWLGGPPTTSYVVRAADKNRLTLSFATLSAGWALGYVFSPAIGGYLASTVGMRVVFLLASTLYASAGIVLLFITSQRPADRVQIHSEQERSIFELLREGKVLRLSILFALIMFNLMMFRPFISRFLADIYSYSEVEIGVLGSVLFFGAAFLGILLGRIGDRWRTRYALATALVFCSLSLALLLVSGDFCILAIALFLAGCSYTMWSLMNAIIGSLAPEFSRARWASIPQAIGMFSSTIAPFIGGVLYDVSPRYPFTIAIATMLVLSLLVATKIFDKA